MKNLQPFRKLVEENQKSRVVGRKNFLVDA